MLLNISFLIVGLVLLTAGAEGLVRGSASLAIRVGIAPLIIGLTIVAFGTSAPELVVSLVASLKNQGDIAVGNVVGSNIFNVGFILRHGRKQFIAFGHGAFGFFLRSRPLLG